MKLELLSPAKNLEFGREAINHGADALYIGAPAFGARAAATNTIEDIEKLVKYAHLYGSKVFVTVNTLLFDNEIDDAVQMIHNLYNIGVDALLIQDMGLLECDLPPIELHASTQCHNASVERIKFLESAGFRRVVLARETSLKQMEEIHKATHVDLEAFVHGALCVSYSGQCYMSQYLNGRSGNRGCCSQPCRSTYDLYNGDGRLLIKEKHLLSLRDFNASQHINSMIEAGITSFKIEGRLKDLSYVKNVTAYYRQLLDGLMREEVPEPPVRTSKVWKPAPIVEPTGIDATRASSGRCTFSFTPDVERTFNRGYTDYYLRERQPMASFNTQKSIGKYLGEVTSIGRYTLTIKTKEIFTNGDGLCYFDTEGNLQGFLVNAVEGHTITPNHMPDIRIGTPVWRNNDQIFEKTLQGKSAERKIGVEMLFCLSRRGFSLDIKDKDGVAVVQHMAAEHAESNKPIHNSNTIVKQLSKLGNTPFTPTKIVDVTEGRYFITAGTLNELRRKAIELLKEYRIKHFQPEKRQHHDQNQPYPTQELDYRANIINQKAEDFYKHHGVSKIERGLEQTEAYDGKALMTTKYCLRYELGCCLQGRSKEAPKADIKPTDELILRNNDHHFRLEFDCAECMMRIYKT